MKPAFQKRREGYVYNVVIIIITITYRWRLVLAVTNHGGGGYINDGGWWRSNSSHVCRYGYIIMAVGASSPQ